MQLLVKIQGDNDRADRVTLEKLALLEQRKQIQATMRHEKEDLMRKFEIIQKTGKIPPELLEKVGKDRLNDLNNSNINNTYEESPNTTKQEVVKPKPFVKPKSVVKPKETKKERVDVVEDSNNTENRTKAVISQNEKYNDSKKTRKDNDKRIKDNDRSKDIEDLKMQQNAELLELLNTEQKIEEEREKMLEKVTENDEKKRLERIFGIERAKASERIIKLSEKHEKALNNISRK